MNCLSWWRSLATNRHQLNHYILSGKGILQTAGHNRARPRPDCFGFLAAEHYAKPMANTRIPAKTLRSRLSRFLFRAQLSRRHRASRCQSVVSCLRSLQSARRYRQEQQDHAKENQRHHQRIQIVHGVKMEVGVSLPRMLPCQHKASLPQHSCADRSACIYFPTVWACQRRFSVT